MTALTIEELAPADLAARLARGNVTLVDVREPAEFAAGHIEGAVLMPLSSFDPSRLPPGDLIFQCGSGKRSRTALERCHAAGLAHRAHLTGGLQAWRQAGLPVAG